MIALEMEALGINRENSKSITTVANLHKNCVFFVVVHGGSSTYRSGSLRRPHPTYSKGRFEHTLSMLQESNSWAKLYLISVHARVRKPFQKKCKIFGTGSRRGATPGRLGAQNRWLLKGFLPEGRLHWTCGRDRLGAHFAWSLLKKSQMSIEVFVRY